MEKKVNIELNGRRLFLNEKARKIATRFFGAESLEEKLPVNVKRQLPPEIQPPVKLKEPVEIVRPVLKEVPPEIVKNDPVLSKDVKGITVTDENTGNSMSAVIDEKPVAEIKKRKTRKK